jgi:hypothetical protein
MKKQAERKWLKSGRNMVEKGQIMIKNGQTVKNG